MTASGTSAAAAPATGSLTATPAQEVEIDVELVAKLLAAQAPQYADLPLTIGPSGWDNVMVRIGDSLAARLPRRQLAASIGVSEWTWLPRVSVGWTFPAPVPLFVGEPGYGFPWRWSVVPWLSGTPALEEPLGPDGAAQLGEALAQVHRAAPAGAPLNPFRSQPIAARAERLDARLESLATVDGWEVDLDAARGAIAAADPWQGGTWCHLDLHGNNVLTDDGALAGIIDWGDSAAGDAPTDLGQVRYLLGATLFDVCVEAYASAGGAGDPRAPRVRAEAVAYALTMASLDDQVYAASGRFALEDLGVARRV